MVLSSSPSRRGSPADRGRQRELAFDLQPAVLAMAIEQRLDRDFQPELVQRRGTQLGDDRPQVLDLTLDVLDRIAHRLLMQVGLSPAQCRGEQHSQTGQALQRLVVQLPRPAPALGLGGGERAAQPVGLDALGERHSGRRARGERAQHLLVVLAEHLALRAAIERRQDARRASPR